MKPGLNAACCHPLVSYPVATRLSKLLPPSVTTSCTSTAFLSEMSASPFSVHYSAHCKQVWTALYLIPLWINTGRKWMWFYNDSLHTGSICFQRNPFKAALASHVYYFLSLWQIYIFSFGYFLPLKRTLYLICASWLGFLCLTFKETGICVSFRRLFFNFCFYFSIFLFPFASSPLPFFFPAASHISTCFSSALLSLLVESQSARGRSLNHAVQLVRDCRPE